MMNIVGLCLTTLLFFLEKRSPLQTRHSIFQELEHLKILVVMKIIYRGLDNIHLKRANFDQ